MQQILAGIETEYGLLVEGRGAEDQIDDAMALVRSYPGECFVGWDYRYESPRADLRGFQLKKLTYDPVDAQFDKGRRHASQQEVRSDRILPNGARFYNDHGHPEYSTPECFSSESLALEDKAGELCVLAAARAKSSATGLVVKVYKNNTDFHGASYGTHENYLVPRAVGFERLYRAVVPMLLARQVLCGAGKVGSETGRSCSYQISQRADFFVEPANAETLFRRPVFNTRDEAHANPAEWIRLHVIAGDANMLASATARKVSLIKLALALEIAGETPVWDIPKPVEAFQSISRDESGKFEIQLAGKSWTTAFEVLESYFAAAESVFGLKAEPGNEAARAIKECRDLMESFTGCPERFAYSVDWAAKRAMLDSVMAEEDLDWRDPSLQAYDLEYHNIEREEGLFHALEQMNSVEPQPSIDSLEGMLEEPVQNSRALARGVAVKNLGTSLKNACWRTLVFEIDGELVEVELEPNREYPRQLWNVDNVKTFISMIRGES